jgi:A/G-specific adenine glycosylase
MLDHESALIQRSLLDWYARHGRDLPWRRTDNPYHIWVAEVMLQQTQVATAIPYYERFLEHFPSLNALAAADLDAVLKVWEGLGYYARARHLHAAAQELVKRNRGHVPETWDELVQLPGIGQYTAGAILSIAFGERRPAVDGNVRRVLSRLFAIQDPIDDAHTRRRLLDLASDLLPEVRPGAFNQALMDLGATICTPQSPACRSCPLGHFCAAYERGLQDTLPQRTPRKPTPHYNVTAGVIYNDDDQVLMAQRPHAGLLGGLWTFPGGRQETGEDPEDCLRRCIKAMLGVDVGVGYGIVTVDHAYTHFRITLRAFRCRHQSGEPQALECADWRWVGPGELGSLALPKVDREVARALLREGGWPDGVC